MAASPHLRKMGNPDHIHLYNRTILFESLTLALVLAGVWLHGSSLFTVMGDRWRSVGQFLRDVAIALIFSVCHNCVHFSGRLSQQRG